MKKAILIILSALLFPFSAHAFVRSCWVLTDIKGVASFKDHAYKIEPDGFSHTNPSIKLIFGGNRATASGDGIGLSQSDDYAATGAASNGNLTVAETYLIDPISGTVLYTKSTFGYGRFDGMTGMKMFRGNARPCE